MAERRSRRSKSKVSSGARRASRKPKPVNSLIRRPARRSQTPKSSARDKSGRVHAEAVEARAQLAATAEILKIIASSPSDIQPVFDVIASSAKRLCGATFGAVFRLHGGMVHFAAHDGFSSEARELMGKRHPRRPQGLLGPTMLER